MNTRKIIRLAALGVLSLAVPGYAATVTISSTRVGGFDAAGGVSNSMASQNFFAGSDATGPTPDRRNFFIFGLVGISAPIVSGKLLLRMPLLPAPDDAPGTPGYFSDDPFETYRISDTPFPVSMILSPSLTTPEALSIHGTLGTGTFWGSADVSASLAGTDVVFDLSPPAIAYLNAKVGTAIAIGGHITTLDGTSPDELIFAFSDIPSPHMIEPRLVLTLVPEPATLSLLAVGTLSLFFRVAPDRDEFPQVPDRSRLDFPSSTPAGIT